MHGCVRGNRAAGFQYFYRDGQVCAKFDIDNAINQFTATGLEDRGRKVLVTMIDDVPGAGILACLDVFGIAGCCDDGCTGTAGPLHGVVADASCTARDEHRLVLDVTIGEYSTMCGHDRNTQAGANVELRVFR